MPSKDKSEDQGVDLQVVYPPPGTQMPQQPGSGNANIVAVPSSNNGMTVFTVPSQQPAQSPVVVIALTPKKEEKKEKKESSSVFQRL